MVLSDQAIRTALERGDIICDPPPRKIESTSIDVRLGEHFWFPRRDQNRSFVVDVRGDARDHWEYVHAPETVILPPQTKVLGHTIEFIGSTVGTIVPHMRCRSTINRWGVSVCQCLDAATEVLSFENEGHLCLRSISEIRVGDRVVSIDAGGKLQTATVMKAVSSWKPRAITLRTRAGRQLRCSLDHELVIHRGDGAQIIQARELRKGDFLPALAAPPQRKITTGDQALFQFIGYYLAEGSYDNYLVSLAQDRDLHPGVRERMKHAMRQAFVDFGVDHMSESKESLRVSNAALCQWMESQGFRRGSRNKRVPPMVFNGSLSDIHACLTAYREGDGSTREERKEIVFSSSSRELLEDIRLLLSYFGARGFLHSRRTGAANTMKHELCVYDQSYDILVSGRPGRDMNVSVPIGGLIRKARGHVGRGQFGPRSTLLYIERGEKNASLKTISRYVRRLEDLRLDSQPLSSLLHADVYYDEIYEAEESDKGSEMFDLTLDQVGLDATFVLGNGLVVHNCAGWGDPGYVSRWTMEIKNDLDYPVLVPVSAYVAQIIFERVEGEGQLYAKHYNAGPDVWTPEHMLPKAIHDER